MHIITGANGLLGCYLSYQLSLQEKKVICVVRNDAAKNALIKTLKHFHAFYHTSFKTIDFAIGDVLDYPFLEEVISENSYVYHLAAAVNFNKKNKNEIFEINVNGTANVVNACLTKNVAKLCFVSSVAAIGRNNTTNPTTENTEWEFGANNANYAISKYNAEMEIWRGAEEGLKTVIVNPSIILGYAAQNKSSASIFYQIKKGFPFISIGANGFVGAMDIVNVLIALAESNIIGERFILNAENISYAALFEKIAKEMGKKTPSIKIKSWMKWIALPIAAAIGFIKNKPPFITKEIFNTALETNQYSADKIIKTIGFSFTPIDKVVHETVQMMS